MSSPASTLLCPVCTSASRSEYEFGCHLIQCGLQLVQKYGEDAHSPLGKRPLPQEKAAEDEEQEEKEEDLAPPSKQQKATQAQSSPSRLPSRSEDSPQAPKTPSSVFSTAEEYDEFLRTVKEGRYKRTGAWKGLKGKIAHECTDAECRRKWKPSPEQSLSDDYHCPSCVLHHRNNESRWDNERLAWTADVPNTFYVFSLVDPHTGQLLYKFGRTQNLDPLKRYPSKELAMYQMKLIDHWRDALRVTVRTENWWKSEAETHNYFQRHSDKSFHGCTECVRVDEDTLQRLLAYRPPLSASVA